MRENKQEAGPKLRLLTLNVGLLNIRIGRYTLREQIAYAEERAAMLPEALAKFNADVILLQEVFHDEHLEYLTSRLSGEYPFIVHSRPNRWHLRFHPGLVTLSRFPMEWSRVVRYLDAPIDERLFALKGWLSCRLSGTPLGDLVLYNTHLNSGGLFRKPHSMRMQQIRMNQMRQLSLAAHRWNHPLTVIGGDLNCGPEISESNYRFMGMHGWDDSWLLRRRPRRPKIEVTWWVGNPLNYHELYKTTAPQRIDHFFLSHKSRGHFGVSKARVVLHDPMVPTRDGGIVTVSDHYGYLVTLEALADPPGSIEV